jgi:hypothetical protein
MLPADAGAERNTAIEEKMIAAERVVFGDLFTALPPAVSYRQRRTVHGGAAW